MKLSRELLFAYVDGALPPDEERRVAEEVAKDSGLHAYVEEQKRLKERLEASFKPIADEPASRERETPIPESPKNARGPAWIPAGAMAAGIALGLLLAGTFGMGGDISGQGGRLIAQGNLARALTVQLAAEADDARDARPRIRLSFVSREGNFCRSFEMARSEGTVFGLACRENGLWRIAALASAAPRSRNDIRNPAAAMPGAIRDAMTAMIVGEALNADAERAARNQGWRAR